MAGLGSKWRGISGRRLRASACLGLAHRGGRSANEHQATSAQSLFETPCNQWHQTFVSFEPRAWCHTGLKCDSARELHRLQFWINSRSQWHLCNSQLWPARHARLGLGSCLPPRPQDMLPLPTHPGHADAQHRHTVHDVQQ